MHACVLCAGLTHVVPPEVPQTAAVSSSQDIDISIRAAAGVLVPVEWGLAALGEPSPQARITPTHCWHSPVSADSFLKPNNVTSELLQIQEIFHLLSICIIGYFIKHFVVHIFCILLFFSILQTVNRNILRFFYCYFNIESALLLPNLNDLPSYCGKTSTTLSQADQIIMTIVLIVMRLLKKLVM